MKIFGKAPAGPVLSKPWSRWLRPGLLAGVAVTTAPIAVLVFTFLPLFVELEDRLADRIRLALHLGPGTQDPRISFVAINEATLANLPYRSPIDRGLLADVMDALKLGGASAVGLDVLVDQATEADKDKRLAKTIREFPGTVVLAWADKRSGLTAAQSDWMAEFGNASGAVFGYVALSAGRQGVVRSHPPESEGTSVPDFATVLAHTRSPKASSVEGLIDWRQSATLSRPAFQKTPAHVLLELRDKPQILKSWFDGRIVIIGADLPLQDRHETPLSVLGLQASATPGALIHAHLVSQMLDDRKVPQMSVLWQMAVVLGLLAVMILASMGFRSLVIKMSIAMVVLTGYLVSALLVVSYGLPLGPLAPAVLGAGLGLLGVSIIDMIAARRDQIFIQGAFSQYLAPEIVTRLLRNPSALSVGGERCEISLLFTDIAGFTSLSEEMPPAQLTALLNGYLDGVCDIVVANNGLVDKFIGDAVVAMFGVPEHDPAHAANAIECARQIDVFSQAYRALPACADLGITRIGVHSGTATVGNFGGNARFDYTAIGDAVNTAARVEAANKYFGTRIAISGDCWAAAISVLDDGLLQPIGDVVLKGKSEPLHLLTVCQTDRPDWLVRYNQAYSLLDSSPDRACVLLEELGDEPVVNFHLSRLRAGERGTVIVMAEK